MPEAILKRAASGEPLKNQALWKIGRNVVNFQRIENALKSLILFSQLEGTPATIAENLDRARARLKRKSLGHLVNDLVSSLYNGPGETSSADNGNDIWISARFRLEIDKSAEKLHKRELKKLVASRNDLIHKRLARFNPDKEEECIEMISFLDDQNAYLTTQMNQLMALRNTRKKQIEDYISYLSSEQFLKDFEEAKRKAGETPVSAAGNPDQ